MSTLAAAETSGAGWAELSSPLAWRLETAVTDRSAGELGCRQHGGIAGTLDSIFPYWI